MGGGQWYGENDNGYGVSILDSGDDDINMYRYGSRRVYEVNMYGPNGRSEGSAISTTKSDAMKRGRDFLKERKNARTR